MERPCVVCGTPLPLEPPSGPLSGARLAYDPERGRLWRVCPGCARWHPVPLELRWEALESCEEAFHARGRVLLTGGELTLSRVDGGELVRVGRPPPVDYAGWRYGEDLPLPPPRRANFWRRLLSSLPPPPLEGYDPYGFGRVAESGRWMASPFLESASSLTAAFTVVPFAAACPSCGGPMPLNPWEFQSVRLARTGDGNVVLAPCAACLREVPLPLREARPALRLGLGILCSGAGARTLARPVARGVVQVGGADAFLLALARESTELGTLDSGERVGLAMVLDEVAEREALELEWREAEEIAAIMDGELTEVPGFQEFRQRVLEG